MITGTGKRNFVAFFRGNSIFYHDKKCKKICFIKNRSSVAFNIIKPNRLAFFVRGIDSNVKIFLFA